MTTQTLNQGPLFALGQIVATPGALETMQRLDISPITLLSRHQRGEWGDLDEDDKRENELSVNEGLRIFSAYVFDTVKFWVITEADRSATTILLPEEY